MGFSWGGFSQGLERGLATGEKLGSMIGDTQIAMLRAKGMKEAKEAAAKAQESAAASVTDNGGQGMAQSAVNGAPQAPTETFQVDMGMPVKEGANPAAQMDGGEFYRAAERAGLPTDPASLNKLVNGVNDGMSLDQAVAAQGIAPTGRYSANGRSFADKGKAEAHAKSKAPTDMDFFIKNAIPQVAAKYIEQGKPELAEAWTQYAGQKKTQKNMETWAKAKRATMSGDFESAADHVMDLYASYDDGVTPMGKEVVKDKDGNVTGFNVKLKDDATGEVRAQFVSPQELDSGLGALAPTEMFKMTLAKQQKAEEIQLRSAADAANDARTMQRDAAKQGMIENRADRREVFKAKAEVVKTEARGKQEIEQIRERARLETEGLGAKAKAELNARTEILRGAGYSEDDINGMIPALLKVDSFKKGTSPEERRAMIVSDMIKGDPRFANLSEEKQNTQVDKMMKVVGVGGAAPAPKPAAAKPKVGLHVYDPDKGMIPIGR